MGKGELVGSCRLHELAVGALDNRTVRHRTMVGCMVCVRKEMVAGTRVNGGGMDGGIGRKSMDRAIFEYLLTKNGGRIEANIVWFGDVQSRGGATRTCFARESKRCSDNIIFIS